MNTRADKELPQGVVVLLRQGDDFLVQHRDNIPEIRDSGLYGPFGGAVEETETPLEAAVRELEEELELIVQQDSLAHLATYEQNYPGWHEIVHMFYLEIDQGAVLRLHEGQAIVRLKDINDAPKDLLSEKLQIISEQYKNKNVVNNS